MERPSGRSAATATRHIAASIISVSSSLTSNCHVCQHWSVVVAAECVSALLRCAAAVAATGVAAVPLRRCSHRHTPHGTLAHENEQRAKTWREHSDVRESVTARMQLQTGQRRRTAAAAVSRLTAHLLCVLRFDSQASVVLSAPSSSRQEEMSEST
jgi:hypothetical protein